MIIRIDSNELQDNHKGYTFKNVIPLAHKESIPITTEIRTLKAGDYESVVAGRRPLPLRTACLERKSLSDLYGTLADEVRRNRLLKKLAIMATYGYVGIVIESEWHEIFNPNQYLPHSTKMRPKSVVAMLLSWEQRFNLHIHPFPGAEVAELMTMRIFERWNRDAKAKKSRFDTAA